MSFYVPTKEYIKLALFAATIGFLIYDIFINPDKSMTFLVPLIILWFAYGDEKLIKTEKNNE